jgi:hypothetical protein
MLHDRHLRPLFQKFRWVDPVEQLHLNPQILQQKMCPDYRVAPGMVEIYPDYLYQSRPNHH